MKTNFIWPSLVLSNCWLFTAMGKQIGHSAGYVFFALYLCHRPKGRPFFVVPGPPRSAKGQMARDFVPIFVCCEGEI